MSNDYLKPEDYVEPRCVLCDEPYGKAPEVKPVPQQRIIEKMDEYLSRKDYAGAERHLKYWLEEARLGGDLRGQLTIRNELIGHYRKRGQKEAAYENIQEALSLLQQLDFSGTISAGTTYTNAATACYTFGDYDQSMKFFENAGKIYEATERTDPTLLGGLYNNMALTKVALKDYDQALALYEKANTIMEQVPGSKPEQAITCLNMANALEQKLGMEAAEHSINQLLDRAEELLQKAEEELASPDYPSSSRDSAYGYYAFVCESCAPTFQYYGYFLTADALTEKAKQIYERKN